jgi:hypothetical protein
VEHRSGRGTIPPPARRRTPSEATEPVPFVLVSLLLAVSVSYARGGRMHRVADASLHWSALLFTGVAVQVLVDVGAARGLLPSAGWASYGLLLASQLLVLGWVVANWHLPGTKLVTLGLALNALVIGANGAMPVDPAAIQALGIEGATVTGGKHVLLDDATRLPWLADIWPLPPLRSIISVGDVVLAAGLIPLAHALMTWRTADEQAASDAEDGDTAGAAPDHTAGDQDEANRQEP